jgi:hypothetical protein
MWPTGTLCFKTQAPLPYFEPDFVMQQLKRANLNIGCSLSWTAIFAQYQMQNSAKEQYQLCLTRNQGSSMRTWCVADRDAALGCLWDFDIVVAHSSARPYMPHTHGDAAN